MLWIFLIEGDPWVFWCSFVMAEYGRFGEWAWVGRVYDVS